MTYTYTRSIITDFGGNFYFMNLKNDIIAQNFTPTLMNILRIGDEINMMFDSELSTSEETTLNTIISNHDSTEPPTYKMINNIALKTEKISTSTYKRVGSFVFPGSDNMDGLSLTKICAIGYMESNATNFSIQICDKTNNLIIAENTFTNTTENSLDLGTISNIPVTESIIEVLTKKNGNKNGYIDSITFYYE